MDIEELEGIDDINWSRLAMCIDCEGSILIRKQKDSRHKAGYRYFVRLQASNTRFILIDWLGYFFEFKIHFRASKDIRHRDQYLAYADGHHAIELIKRMLPWILIKDELAQIAIEMQDSLTYKGRGQGVCVPKDVIDARDALYLRAKQLNKKGR